MKILTTNDKKDRILKQLQENGWDMKTIITRDTKDVIETMFGDDTVITDEEN